MRFTLAVALTTIAVLHGTAVRAQAPIWHWCDTWQAYYPRVVSCPVPWRAVAGSTSGRPQPRSSCRQVSRFAAIPSFGRSPANARTPTTKRKQSSALKQQKALLADQNGWVESYAATWGYRRTLRRCCHSRQESKSARRRQGERGSPIFARMAPRYRLQVRRYVMPSRGKHNPSQQQTPQHGSARVSIAPCFMHCGSATPVGD
jgi:hypothetical protein